jgi:cell division protein FtsQ
MNIMRKISWKKVVVRSGWVLLGVGVMVILGAAMISQYKQPCQGIQVKIKTNNTNLLFIDEKEIATLLDSTFSATGKAISQLPLRSMELMLERNPWIANAEIFVDNNKQLQVSIVERTPIARIFTLQNNSYYIDSTGVRLPLSSNMTARVPVFTDFPSDQEVLSGPDSALLADIISISRHLAADSFWNAQVSQVAILPANQFELFLLTGAPNILLGDASGLTEKFQKLNAYFHSDYFTMGYGSYSKINVQFRRQLIGIKSDSSRRLTMIDSAGFYRAVEGIESGVNQLNVADKTTPLQGIPAQQETKGNQPEKVLISKDKNIQKSYNNTSDLTLSKKVLSDANSKRQKVKSLESKKK